MTDKKLHRELNTTFNSVTNISLDSSLQDDCSRSTTLSTDVLEQGFECSDNGKHFMHGMIWRKNDEIKTTNVLS